MAVKRFNPMDDPPTASSSEEDEVETSARDGDVSSSSEEEDNASSKKLAVVNKPETTLVAVAATDKKSQVSDSESGSENETDSDSETEKRDPGKNQVSTFVKPKDSPGVKKDHESKKVETLAKSQGKKRSLETEGAAESKDAKRAKRISGEDEKKKSGGGEETKKTNFQRVWSEENEIALLQGVIDYKTETGASPYDDMNGFYQFVKKAISFDVSKTQLTEKLRSFKKKFENNVGKGKNGEEPVFSKAHDQKAFDLSKSVWGSNEMLSDSAVKSNGKSKSKSGSKSSKKVEPVKAEPLSPLKIGKSCEDEVMTNVREVELDSFAKSVLGKSLARFGVDDLAAQQGWIRLSLEDKKRFEEQWKVLLVKEFEFYSEKSSFIREVVTKMAEAFRSNP